MLRIVLMMVIIFFTFTKESYSDEQYYCPDVDRAVLNQIESNSDQGYAPSQGSVNVKKYLNGQRTFVTISGIKKNNDNVTQFHARPSTSYADLGVSCLEDVLSRICPNGYLKPDGINITMQCKGYTGGSSGGSSGGGFRKDKDGVYRNY